MRQIAKYKIVEIESVKMINSETGEEIKHVEKEEKVIDPRIKGCFKYSADSIENISKQFNFKPVNMKGFNNDLIKLKQDIENLYDKNVFHMGMIFDDAPYHGWSGESLKEMREIDREINKRVEEIYAILLQAINNKGYE